MKNRDTNANKYALPVLVSAAAVACFLALAPDIRTPAPQTAESEGFVSLRAQQTQQNGELAELYDSAPIFVPTKWNNRPATKPLPTTSTWNPRNERASTDADETSLSPAESRKKTDLKRAIFMRSAFAGFAQNPQPVVEFETGDRVVVKDLRSGATVLEVPISLPEHGILNMAEFYVSVKNSQTSTPIKKSSSGNDEIDKAVFETLNSAKLDVPDGEYKITVVPY